jgi:menaquinone-9 beta-reductase
MESCDALIIGAGPAGSTCARILTSARLSVLLMDRDQFPRDKPCAGWITPAVLQQLGITAEQYRGGRLLQEIRAFRTGVMFGSEIVTDYRRTVSYAIRRCEFDHFLLLKSGARTLLGEQVTTLEREEGGWLVNGWIKARVIVGAGGHLCPVAKALGALPGREPAIAAMVAEWEMQEEDLERVLPGIVLVSFTPDLSGYGWMLRKGNYLNVGLGSLEGRDVRRQALEFCAELRRRGELNEDISARFRGHAYLPYQGKGGRSIVAERAVLIGDAAGVSSPESGEGILPAIETALLAAQTIVAAGGDYRRERLEPYAAAVAGRFGKGAGIGVALPQAMKRLAGSAVLSSRWLTRHLVLDRWFLHSGAPPLELAAAQVSGAGLHPTAVPRRASDLASP